MTPLSMLRVAIPLMALLFWPGLLASQQQGPPRRPPPVPERTTRVVGQPQTQPQGARAVQPAEGAMAEVGIPEIPTPPVTPPEGALFVAVGTEPGAYYYPIACTAWYEFRNGLQWFNSELEARNEGLRPTPACRQAPRYQNLGLLRSAPPAALPPPAGPADEGPEPAEPAGDEKPAEESPPPPVEWRWCEVAFVSGASQLLCRDGTPVVLLHEDEATAPTSRRDLQAAVPMGSRVPLEIVYVRGTDVYARRLAEAPPPTTTPPPPPAEIRSQQCVPLHGAWMCGKPPRSPDPER